jgi:membrane peptidoglycan carboxypeptidase
LLFLLVVGLCVWGGVLALDEINTYKGQARILSQMASRMQFELADGPSSRPLSAPAGPYDMRFGYTRLPDIKSRMEKSGYVISREVRPSDSMLKWSQWGGFPIFHEKTVSGLTLLDRMGEEIYARKYPRNTFSSFSEIPPVLVEMLLFIENRDLLDPQKPLMNPAVAWERLAKALFDNALQLIVPSHSAAGGSTLATQTEKFRHSPEGVTHTARDKLYQMASASLRGYLDGENTLQARKNIVLNYINSIPLAAQPDYGEVNGLGDGLWAWFGADLNRVATLFRDLDATSNGYSINKKALAVKQVLSLFLAHRRPSHYLIGKRDDLEALCETYLDLLSSQGILSKAICSSAYGQSLPWRSSPPPSPAMTQVEKKASNTNRIQLLSLLGVKKLYELDRMDLTAKSTLDLTVQTAVSEEIMRLHDPAYLTEKGLYGYRLLGKGDPKKITYGFTLYEKTPRGNVLRVQTDNYDQALNINEGVKMELGSTAKLRTLVTYLEIVSTLFDRYSQMARYDLLAVEIPPRDTLTAWAISYLIGTQERNRLHMLNAAMQRTYSASPAEGFFTGGGLHSFENFNPQDNYRTVTVIEGLRYSINMVFIRLMRDIVRYYIYNPVNGPGAHLRDPLNPQRRAYLEKFADLEGTKFVRMFYRKYAGKSQSQILSTALQSVSPVPARLAYVCRFLAPEMELDEFAEEVKAHLPKFTLTDDLVQKLYWQSDPDRFTLSDRGYLSRMHPLELWVADFLRNKREASLQEILTENASVRQEVYKWLFRSSQKRAQDQRIYTMLEIEAFVQIHQAWKQVGYPFGSLVPSLATAIGSSGDRPAALAELMGVIVNRGIRMPLYRIETLVFAAGTPYEVHFERGAPVAPEKILEPDIADVLKDALSQVVESGTAQRAFRSFVDPDGTVIPLGGKTGTGDNRYEKFGRGGNIISSKVLNRSSTFVFFLGDRFFGVVLAYVDGPNVAAYDFTSALPVTLLKILVPRIMPLFHL